MSITVEQFKTLFPHVSTAVFEPLNRAMTRFDINSKVRMAAFLAQIGHESGGLTVFEENLNYTAQGLAKTWPKRFAEGGKPNELAQALARKPAAIASVVYANRMGNGDEASGDGWEYRGRGPIQVTGKDGYAAAGSALGISLLTTPELLLDPEYGCLAAARYWHATGCNELADTGQFTAITKKINGGINGLEDRKARWAKAKTVLLAGVTK